MRSRRGFTLIELMISMVVLLIITGAAVQFLRKQTGLVTRETSRMDALQNAQFSASQIERDLREAGAGVADFQPTMVQVDSMAFTFNANITSIDSGDVRAVYQIPDADTNLTRAMLRADRVPLPNSNPQKYYPDSTYYAATGVQSGAETISYFLRSDSTISQTNRYLLFRRVNGAAAELVARGIVRDSRDTIPFFTYYKTDTLNRLVPISKTLFPLYHGIIHGAVDDTGRFALTDSVKAVKIHFATVSRDLRTGQDALRTVETMVRILNAGLLERTSCGQPPVAVPGTVSAVSSPAAAPVKSVTLSWSATVDDNTGERDIERYAVFRRLSSATAFGDPISSIPSSRIANYTYVDRGVIATQSYVYGIAAQDCTPSLSGVVASNSVTVIPTP